MIEQGRMTLGCCQVVVKATFQEAMSQKDLLIFQAIRDLSHFSIS